MSVEENKAIVGRWFTEFWGPDFNPAVIDELAAPDIRFEYSLHAPCRGREEVRAFAAKFRAAFPDLAPRAQHDRAVAAALAAAPLRSRRRPHWRARRGARPVLSRRGGVPVRGAAA
jgi:hypothetical protein